MLALEPPGNVARDLASYKRSLFAGLGEASGLAFPEVAALAFSRRETGAPPRPRAAAARSLEEAWEGIEGGFSSGGTVSSKGILYLELFGPVEDLASRAGAALRNLGLSAFTDAPIEAGRGFLLCGSARPDSALSAFAEPPALAFRDCALVLLGMRFGSDPFAAATWRELARSKRRTGPSSVPSQRRSGQPRRA
jgi:hypothetical protein